MTKAKMNLPVCVQQGAKRRAAAGQADQAALLPDKGRTAWHKQPWWPHWPSTHMTRKLVEHPLFLGGRRASAGLPAFQSHNPPVEAEHAVALDVRRACRQERQRTGKRAGAGAGAQVFLSADRVRVQSVLLQCC